MQIGNQISALPLTLSGCSFHLDCELRQSCCVSTLRLRASIHGFPELLPSPSRGTLSPRLLCSPFSYSHLSAPLSCPSACSSSTCFGVLSTTLHTLRTRYDRIVCNSMRLSTECSFWRATQLLSIESELLNPNQKPDCATLVLRCPRTQCRPQVDIRPTVLRLASACVLGAKVGKVGFPSPHLLSCFP